MKLSIVTPVVSLHPGAHGPWEVDATIEDVALVAETADRLGYHYLTCSEHIAIPATELDRRAGRATGTAGHPRLSRSQNSPDPFYRGIPTNEIRRALQEIDKANSNLNLESIIVFEDPRNL
jgi:exonuclease I